VCSVLELLLLRSVSGKRCLSAKDLPIQVQPQHDPDEQACIRTMHANSLLSLELPGWEGSCVTP
jgi:hypothetical protein